jgi:hypothetical protein
MSFKPGTSEAERVAKLNGLPWPRDPSALARSSHDRPQRSSARKPLGLSLPDDDREERAASAYDDPVAEIAAGVETMIENLGGRAATKASKASVLDMIQTLGEALTATVQGDGVLYDLILAERKRTAALESDLANAQKEITDLRVAVAMLQGAASERARGSIIRP